ncbi:hypothetical protein scyTo_0012837, partial [Scyliorhinus torazame]|nr:hypothetical protein [Scyliorhinus torazame]
MAEKSDRVPSKKAGLRAAVVLIGLLHRSRKEKIRRKQEMANGADMSALEPHLSPPHTAPPSTRTLSPG